MKITDCKTYEDLENFCKDLSNAIEKSNDATIEELADDNMLWDEIQKHVNFSYAESGHVLDISPQEIVNKMYAEACEFSDQPFDTSLLIIENIILSL